MSRLYTTQLLALSTKLANYPLRDGFESVADARSSLCGSTITVGIDMDGAGCVRDIGMLVSACAIGQGSAAILAGGAKGASAEDIYMAHFAIRAWIAEEGDLPAWPGIEAIVPARDHPGRHGAVLLGWDAVTAALRQTEKLST